MERVKKYKIMSTNCVNSNWTARFLAKKNQEYCQCMFSCKIKVKDIASDYQFIISENEYWKLKAKELI